jgi:hypothetical protein
VHRARGVDQFVASPAPLPERDDEAVALATTVEVRR